MTNPIARWRAKQQEKQKELLFYERLHMPFKGSIFQTQSLGGWPVDYPDVLLTLQVFDQVYGLGDCIRSNPVPTAEFVMATGKAVARKFVLANKLYNLIFALECITSKGIGYLPRERLRGPLKKVPDGVRLSTD